MRLAAVLLTVLACSQATIVNGELAFDREELVFSVTDGMTIVGLVECGTVWEPGAPSLPIATAQLVVPQGMRVTGVVLDEFETEAIEGEFDIRPVQEPRPLSDDRPPEFTGPDPDYYGAFEYPGDIVTVGAQGSMFGYNLASVFVAPVQYNASEKKLVFHPRVRFTLEMEPAEFETAPVSNRSSKAQERIEENLAGLVLNPEDLSRFAPGMD